MGTAADQRVKFVPSSSAIVAHGDGSPRAIDAPSQGGACAEPTIPRCDEPGTRDAKAGGDVDENGNGAVVAPRMYQLIRQQAPIVDRRFEIEFLDPGAEIFSFTFG